MSHPLVDVTAFQITGNYRLLVSFDDGLVREIDFHPVLHGEMLGPLRDVKLFNQVRLDHETGTLVWPNGADFDPWMLHEWPVLAAELAAQASQWDSVLA